MTLFFKGLALLVVLCCLVWVGMLWHWQNTQHDMSVNDVLLYLVALPLTLFALVLLGGWAWRGASAKAEASSKANATAATVAAARRAPSKDKDEAARHATWQLLCAHGSAAFGASVEEWLAAAKVNEPTPALDDELRDSVGLPVICARVPGLDVAALDDELEPLLKSIQPQHPQLTLSASFLRTLALLREPLAAAVAGLAPWAPVLSAAPPDKKPAGRTAAAGEALPLADTRVGVLVAWPPQLHALETELAQRWLTQQLEQAGTGLVAPQRWAMLPPLAAEPESVSASHAGPRLWLQADVWFDIQRREQRQDPLLLMATHSDISAESLERLQAQGDLFSASRPKGLIPGEAAVAVLLAPASWPADPQSDTPKPHLHRAAVARRDKRIDAPGRLSHDLAQQLVVQAAAAAQHTPDALGAVVNDADQHTARGAELFAAMLAELPKLDPSEDMRMFGHLCGHIGACGTLMAAAMAAQQASQSGQPCLALALGDAQWRAALVARPAAPPNAATADAPQPQASSGPGA